MSPEDAPPNSNTSRDGTNASCAMAYCIKGAPNWGTQESESTYAAFSIALTMKPDNFLVGNAR